MTDFTAIKQMLTPPVNRDNLVEIMAKGIVLPTSAKVLAYMAVQRMPQAEVDNIANLARAAVAYIEVGDRDGLQDFLKACNIPAEIGGLIMGAFNRMKPKETAKEENAED